MERVPWQGPSRGIAVDDVTFPGFAGDPIRAWFLRPRDADGPLPTVVQFLGYGGGRELPLGHLHWANAGYAQLVMDTRGQGSTWGSGGDTPDPYGAGAAHPGSMTRASSTSTSTTTGDS